MNRPEPAMSDISKRSVSIRGHRTSISLEEAFLAELRRIAERRGISLSALIVEIDATRSRQTNLSSALRLHVLDALKAHISVSARSA